MESTGLEFLERIAGRLEVLDRIEERLGRLEQKVEQITAPPRAVKISEAEKYLPIKRTVITEMINAGKIATCTINERKYIPFAELVRLTAVAKPVASSPTVPPPPKRGPGRPRGSGKKKVEAKAQLRDYLNGLKDD